MQTDRMNKDEQKQRQHLADINRFFGYLGAPEIQQRGDNTLYFFIINDSDARKFKSAVDIAITKSVESDIHRRSAENYEGERISPFLPLLERCKRSVFENDALIAHDNPDPVTRKRELAISADLMEAIHIQMGGVTDGIDIPSRVPFREDFKIFLKSELSAKKETIR